MANAPFSGDFESLARQYWNTWNELLGARSGGALDGWGLLGGLPPGLGRMDPGAYDWYQRMQRLAADFSGGGKAADIASAWRDMLGGQAHAAEPFAGMLRSMHGGLAGGDWLEQMRPLLDMMLRPLRQQSADWLQRPAFGPAREHQERLQALALAWQQWEERNEAFTALLAQAGQGAFERFERLLEQHDAPGKRLESARALFDLWIDAAEEAWAEIAMSAEYRHAYAEMTNALMRLRLGLQREVEQFGAMLGLPGRSEMDALHRKVADLERSLHAARRGAAKPAAARPAQASSRPARPAVTPGVQEQPEAEAPTVAARSPAKAKAAGSRTRKRTSAAVVAATRPPAKAAKKTPARGSAPRRAAASAGVAGAAKAAPPAASTRAAAAKAPAAKAVVAKPAERKAAAKSATAKPPANASASVAPKPARTTKSTKPAVAIPRKPAAPRRAPVKAAAKSAPQASTATARKARVVKVAKAAAQSAPAKAAAAPASVKVVSMKDWVSRNLSASHADARPRGKKVRK